MKYLLIILLFITAYVNASIVNGPVYYNGSTVAAADAGIAGQYFRSSGPTNAPAMATILATEVNGLSAVATTGNYSDLSGIPVLSMVATSGLYTDLIGSPSLAVVATTGSYNDLSNQPSIPAAQIQSDWSQSNSSSTDYIKNKPSARSQSSVTRNLNMGFQISSTRDCLVNYAITVTTTANLISGQSGSVFLDIASDSGFTMNLQSIGSVNGNSVSLAIALTAIQSVTATLSYYVPAGYYIRIRTVNTLGTPTFSYAGGQEVLL